jgi:hypothetical protein
MDTSIKVAIISGLFALLAPIITYVVTKELEDRYFEQMPYERQNALSGRWEGMMYQEVGFDGERLEVPMEIPIDIEATVSGRRLEGVSKVKFPLPNGETDTSLVNFTGGFLHDRFIKIDYKNSNLATIQFGSMILELNSRGNMLSGRFLGYGDFTEVLVFGKVKCQKVH